MKPRIVMVSLELNTDMSLKDLKGMFIYRFPNIKQISMNVVKETKKGVKRVGK